MGDFFDVMKICDRMITAWHDSGILPLDAIEKGERDLLHALVGSPDLMLEYLLRWSKDHPPRTNEPESDFSNKFDTVTKPEHYNQGGIECIDAIKASMSREEYLGFLKGQVIKYLWRYRHKGNPEQDLRKAEYYNTKLIDEIKEGHNEE